jgi:hypothetical protein
MKKTVMIFTVLGEYEGLAVATGVVNVTPR